VEVYQKSSFQSNFSSFLLLILELRNILISLKILVNQNNITMIEFLYLASQIQCGASGDFLNVKVDIYQNQELIETVSVNEKVLLPVDPMNEVEFKYSAVNNPTASCLVNPSQLVLSADDQVPDVAGAYEQESIQKMLDGLNTYEELFLVELGTTDQFSAAFDRQDVVGIVNNNPTVATIVAPD